MPLNPAHIIFAFFCFAFLGWFAESAQESITRKKIISKGFFYGPVVPVQGVGGLVMYFALSYFRAQPAAIFFGGLVLGTIVEYITALFLEKCFHVQCWDYRSYPHTRWCHFQGRVCLTISLFFGVVSLAVVYALWDLVMAAAARLGGALPVIDTALVTLFTIDALLSCLRVIKAKRAGRPLSGWAVFSPPPPPVNKNWQKVYGAVRPQWRPALCRLILPVSFLHFFVLALRAGLLRASTKPLRARNL